MARIARTPTEQAASGGSEFHAERNLELTARQRELFCALRAGPNPGLTLAGYGGAMGGGKTKAIVELAIDAALAFPGNNVLVARQHYTDLSATTMQEFYAACPPEYLRQRVTAPTPLARLGDAGAPASDWSTVNFRHLSDWQGLGSQQYGSVLIDEAGQVDEEAALMLLTRLRHPAQPQRWFVAASNPWPGWFQRWFVGHELPEDALNAAQGQVSFIPRENRRQPASAPELRGTQPRADAAALARALHRGPLRRADGPGSTPTLSRTVTVGSSPSPTSAATSAGSTSAARPKPRTTPPGSWPVLPARTPSP